MLLTSGLWAKIGCLCSRLWYECTCVCVDCMYTNVIKKRNAVIKNKKKTKPTDAGFTKFLLMGFLFVLLDLKKYFLWSIYCKEKDFLQLKSRFGPLKLFVVLFGFGVFCSWLCHELPGRCWANHCTSLFFSSTFWILL